MILFCITLFLMWYLFYPTASTPYTLNVYFGIPGAGKTTFASHLANQAMYEHPFRRWLREFDTRESLWLMQKLPFRKSKDVYSNVPITGTFKLDVLKQLGVDEVSKGVLIFDEAGIYTNNRKFNAFPENLLVFFKMFRHEEMACHVFSQSYKDMDLTIRNSATAMWMVKKSIFRGYIVAVKYKKFLFINEETNQFEEGYRKCGMFSNKYCYAKKVYHLFNTHSRIEGLNVVEWEKW